MAGQTDRVILHCDANNFFASVESLAQPKLKTVPMAVSNSDDRRHGVILAKNDLAKPFGVKTAWHGPGDVSPIGHMANVHLDLTTTNFGIQEWCGMETNEQVREVFEGCAEIHDGFAWANDKPGWGMEVNLEAAKKYPCDGSQPRWLLARLPDGTSVKA